MSTPARVLAGCEDENDAARAIYDAGDEIRERMRTGAVLRRVPNAIPPEKVSEAVVDSLAERGYVLPWPMDRQWSVVEFRAVHAQVVPRIWERG